MGKKSRPAPFEMTVGFVAGSEREKEFGGLAGLKPGAYSGDSGIRGLG